MARTSTTRKAVVRFAVFGLLTGAISLLLFSRDDRPSRSASELKPSGEARLISLQRLPAMDGEMCQWVPARAGSFLSASFPQSRQPSHSEVPTEVARAEAAKRLPIRTLRDSYTAYSAVAVDPTRNEVMMTDENLYQILVYDRRSNTPPTATMSEPKRVIGGSNTELEYQCALYVDPANGDIYAVNNDTVDKLVIFSNQDRGNVHPGRFIATPHTTFGIAVNEKNQELLLTVQDDAAVVTYPKSAKGEDPPIRLLQGEKTLLADPHGIALDPKTDLIYVANWGVCEYTSRSAERPTRGDAGRQESGAFFDCSVR